MTKDPREKEAEFVSGLAADTRRDLAAWMALIDAQTFAHRNDMIDWLRQQGLTFAKASKLERIHHNGGRPLYGDKPRAKVPTDPVPAITPLLPVIASARPPVQPAAIALPVADTARGKSLATDSELASFLAKAKGYRPLAELLMARIRQAVPTTSIQLYDTHADLMAPKLYAAIAVTAKDIRLALDLGEHPFDGDFKRLRLPGMAANMTHTLILNDARKIDDPLLALIVEAVHRANA